MTEEYKYYILAKASVIFHIFLVIKVLQMQRFGKTVGLPHLSPFPIPNNHFL